MDENYQDEAEQQQTWWQKIKQYSFITVEIVVTIFALIVFILAVSKFGWDWTGFTGGESKVTKTPQGTNIEYSSGRTLWDWMQLLLVPIMLAIGGFWLNQIQKSREERITERQKQNEQVIARDNQQEQILQTYLDAMSGLLLKEHLGDLTLEGKLVSEYEKVRKIARVRTLTVLPRLDDNRKRSVLQFLYESGLIHKDPTIIDLSGADFINADLRGLNLQDANLSNTNLRGAKLSPDSQLGATDLSGAILRSAILRRGNLRGAILLDADLSGTDLRYTKLISANLEGAKLQKARYNTKKLQEMRETNGQRKGVIIDPTSWPQGFEPKSKGAICVDC